MTLDEYIDSLRGSRVAVVGLGVSNRPLLQLLLSHGVDVTVRDKRSGEQFGEKEKPSHPARSHYNLLRKGNRKSPGEKKP